MKQNGIIEIATGFIVIIVAVVFFAFVYNTSNSKNHLDGYNLYASFENIEGINKGSDIMLSGIKIGYIQDINLDKDTYFATLTLLIDNKISIPKDSIAIISTSGLLGGKYLRINPGADSEMIKSGGRFKLTQSALNIEDLIAKLMYSFTNK